MRSFASFSFFEFSESFLVSFFFGDGSFVGSMFVIRLIDGDEWGVDWVIHDESTWEDEDLPHPWVLLEDFSKESPSGFSGWAGIEGWDDLGCSFFSIMKKSTESWFDSLWVGNSWIPFRCVFLNVVIEDSSVNHPVVLVCENYQIII